MDSNYIQWFFCVIVIVWWWRQATFNLFSPDWFEQDAQGNSLSKHFYWHKTFSFMSGGSMRSKMYLLNVRAVVYNFGRKTCTFCTKIIDFSLYRLCVPLKLHTTAFYKIDVRKLLVTGISLKFVFYWEEWPLLSSQISWVVLRAEIKWLKNLLTLV